MLLFDDTAGEEHIKLRAQKDLMFKALNNEQRDILGSQTENIGGDETITVGAMTIGAQTIGGNFTLNALQTAKINVGPVEQPLTQILMDTSSITLNVGPNGAAAQIVMNMTGITLNVGPSGLIAQIVMGPTGVAMSGTPLSQLMVQPQGICDNDPDDEPDGDGPDNLRIADGHHSSGHDRSGYGQRLADHLTERSLDDVDDPPQAGRISVIS